MSRHRRSLAQNIDALCFSEHGKLRDEFNYLYSSLFHDAAAHLKIVTALASCKADTGTSANCRITIIAAAGIKLGVHAAVAQNTLTLEDILNS